MPPTVEKIVAHWSPIIFAKRELSRWRHAVASLLITGPKSVLLNLYPTSYITGSAVLD